MVKKYDLTDYQLKHPGGGLIKKAAGEDLARSLETKWCFMAFEENPRVMNVLKKI